MHVPLLIFAVDRQTDRQTHLRFLVVHRLEQCPPLNVKKVKHLVALFISSMKCINSTHALYLQHLLSQNVVYSESARSEVPMK